MSAADEVAAEFEGFALAAKGTSVQQHAKGDYYGAALAKARSQAYREAAELMREHDPVDAVRMMIERAARSCVRFPPMANFDPAGLAYARARAYQYCARHVDPLAPLVQEEWP